VLEAAIESSRPHWEKQGQHFELNMLSGPIYVDADEGRLAQAFSNLLTNAAKYTDRGGRISLTVRQEGGMAVVSVQDSGIGISPEMLPRLFDIFSQAPAALERSQGGLGLGLSIVRALVHMHGGTVEASSAGLGHGSTFTVKLPAAAQRLAPRSAATQARTTGPSLHVLVADDNADAAETTSVLLEMLGHDVRVARDGDEALHLASSFAPDVALLDIGMPKRNGYEVATELRTIYPGITLVAITGWAQIEDMKRAAGAGFDYHLVKPVDPDQLLNLLARIRRPSREGEQAPPTQ
jgi:CheY-like chemotaxis protein